MSVGPVLFSAVEGQEFGSFHYHLGLIHHSFGDVEAALVRAAHERGSAHKEVLNPVAEDVATAFRVASLFHETRHLIDGFGTLAGISLFGKAMELLKELCRWASAFGSMGSVWQLPLRDWVMAADCPQEMRDFVRRLRAFHQAEPLFLAMFRPLTVQGHLEDMLVEVPSQGGSVLQAFPLRMVQTTSDNPEDVKLLTVLFPVGFEAMVEGSAHAVCRNIVSHLFTEEVADELMFAVRFRDLENEGDEDDLLASTPPYMVTDLMISRFLRSRGIEQFRRDTVLGLTDLVLGQSVIQTIDLDKGVTGVKFDNFGALLLDILKDQPLDGLAEGRVTPSDVFETGYATMLEGLEQGGDWDTVEDDHSPLSSVMIWESYCAQNLTVPLLRKRIETGHSAFQTDDGFYQLLPIIQDAALRTSGANLQSNLPLRVMQAWAHVVMLSALARQIATDKSVLICPRRFRAIPGIAALNFAEHGNCDMHAQLGCGAFEHGVFAHQPSCLFEGALRRFNLSRD